MAEVLEIPIAQLLPDANQPRADFDAEAIERLAASIRARGILHPLRVLFDEERQCWRIVTGECRWRAAKLAGLASVPCLPVEGPLSDTDVLSDQIIENSVRKSLRPLELARALAKLKALRRCNSQTLAAELGLSPASITRAESLLELPGDVQALVDAGRVPESSAYELSKLKEEAAQRELAEAISNGRMKRDAVVEAVRGRIGRKRKATKTSRLACKLDGGISVVLSSEQPPTWDELLAALDRVRKEVRKLSESGAEITALGKRFQAV